ncbi:hypothetical protein BsWGS_21016 [Bradybaena similaris]
MNRHALFYHTRLHDWYRQHSILQEKQRFHHSDDIPPPSLANGSGQLTADKLTFINDWCLEVNETFFAEEEKKKKTPKPVLKHQQHKQRSSPKDFSKSTDFKPVRGTHTSTMTDTQNKNFQSVKHTGLSTTARGAVRRPNGGLADKHRYRQHAKKTGLSNVKAGKLDLCVRNSTKEVIDDNSGTRGSHNFLTTRRSQMKQKQNGSQSSAQFKSSSESRSLVGNDNPYGYYGFISAIVRNVAQCNNNRRVGENDSSVDTPHPQETTKSEDSCVQHKLATSSCESFQAPRNKNINLQKANKTQLEKNVTATSSIFFVEDGVCTNDNEITLASVSGLDYAHHGNITNVRNIDPSKRGGSLPPEHKQDNAPNQISDKENNLKRSTALTENESIHVMSGVMKNKMNYTNANNSSKQEHAQPNWSAGIETDSSSGHDMKNVRIGNSTRDCDGTSRLFQNILNEKDDNGETKMKVSNININVEIASETKLQECNNTGDKAGNVCDLRAETIALGSSCGSDCIDDTGESCSRMETATIAHFCLSNRLLNMMTIDDCKISQRYSLLKASKPGTRQVKTSSREPDEVKNLTNKAIAGNSQDKRNIRPHLSQAIKVNLARNNPPTPLENSELAFHKIKCSTSTNFERSLNALIHDKTPLQDTQQGKPYDGKKTAVLMSKNEGPIYRRLHAALRKEMEKLRPSQCVQLQH